MSIEKTKKGWRKEKEARDMLIKDGWTIAFKSVRYRFGTIDFMGLFDIVAYKDTNRKYISCKHLGIGNYYLDHQRQIIDTIKKYGVKEKESFELWLWDKARYRGRGKNKIWIKGHFKIYQLN